MAADTNQAVIVHPIRGQDFWEYQHNRLETPKEQYKLLQDRNLPATWLIRYDAFLDPEIVSFLQGLNQNQEIGLFLEITPSLTSAAGVKYNESANWHYAKSVLTIGYSPEDRIKLVDAAVTKYQELFKDKKLKSVGAWWIDVPTLNYLREKYQIEANLIVADQHTTDQYQVWGQYWSTPYYPSKFNALMPAENKDQQLGMVTMQWATRDPFNAYGPGVRESTFSVQANDYMLHGLGIDYFQKLLAIYPQTTVGLENDFGWAQFGAEYGAQLKTLADWRDQGKLRVLSMADYAMGYQQKYGQNTPKMVINADDPLGTGQKVVWANFPKYRAGIFVTNTGVMIRDFRAYNSTAEEDCAKEVCQTLDLSKVFLNALDEVSSGKSYSIDQGSVSNWQVREEGDQVVISYKNQSGVDRQIKLMPSDIQINDKIWTMNTFILEAIKASTDSPKQLTKLPFNLNIWSTIPSQIVSFLKFILFLGLMIIGPGWLITRSWSLSIPLGLVIFSLLSWILGWLKIDWLLYGLIGVSVYGWWRSKDVRLPKWRDINWLAVGLVSIGSIFWWLTSAKNGLESPNGFGYWGPHGHDGIWHLALIRQLQQTVPPENPVFSGTSLNNYHYFFDLVIAKSGQLWMIDPQDLLFRWFPLLIALLIGGLTYRLVSQIKSAKGVNMAALWSVFFVYFGGSLGWMISLYKNGDFGGESKFWSMQSISTLLNPPFAMSLVLLLAGYLIFLEIQQHRRLVWRLIIGLVLLWGVVIEFKAYAGVLAIGALWLVALEQLIRQRDFKLLIAAGLSSLVSAVVFLPNNAGGSGLFVWHPGWFISTMIEFPDRLGWQRVLFTLNSGVWYKVWAVYIAGTAVFIIGNWGSRILSLTAWKIWWQQRWLMWVTLLGVLASMLLIQKGTNWNTIQFFYYSQFIAGIMAGIGMASILKLGRFKWMQILLGITVVILTIPTTFDSLRGYLPGNPPSVVTKAEVEVLTKLADQPRGVVLTLPYDYDARKIYQAPVPMFAYERTAYVSAFSGQPTVIEDQVNLDILGIDYKGRLNDQIDAFRNASMSKQILDKYQVKYVYLVKSQASTVNIDALGLESIFENQEAAVYRVRE